MTLHVLKEKGESNRAVARRLGVSEGAVRYHLRRKKANAVDGRGKTCLIEKAGLTAAVEHWWRSQEAVLPKDRPPNVCELWTHLVDEYSFDGSYKVTVR